MSYSVRLDDNAQRKISEWRLPKEGISAILRRMDELSDNPSRYLLRIASSPHVLETDVVYTDPGPPELNGLVALSVRYSVDEETLYIVDCYRIFDEKADRTPPGTGLFSPSEE
jgi:hypothetical protein